MKCCLQLFQALSVLGLEGPATLSVCLVHRRPLDARLIHRGRGSLRLFNSCKKLENYNCETLKPEDPPESTRTPAIRKTG